MSLLSKDGVILAHTIQKGLLKRERDFAASAGIRFGFNEQVYNNVYDLIKKLNYSGIAHVDLRYDKKRDEYVIIEINARYWGSLTGSIMAGVNFPYIAIMSGLQKNYTSPAMMESTFVDFISAIKYRLRNLFQQNTLFQFEQTDYKYVFRDPIAELWNIWRRRNN
jgi:D-aspartate ligase